MNTDLNKEISHFFQKDARAFFNRYALLKESSTHLGTRSKLLLDLLFAIECTLKALIFFESNEDEIKTYKKIKEHRFDKLIKLLSPEAQTKCEQYSISELNEYYVDIRYTLEAHVKFRTEQGILGKEYYSTIANSKWLDNVNDNAKLLLKYVESRNPPEIESCQFSEINVKDELEKHALFEKLARAKKQTVL
jgi:hypothetical protein